MKVKMNENEEVKKKEDIMDSNKKTDDTSEVGGDKKQGFSDAVIDKTDHLKSLGSQKTEYATDTGIDPSLLEPIPNLYEGRDYTIRFETKEFSSLCPRTRQPDVATIIVKYIPDALMIESKSLKLYFVSYRSAGMFMESICNQILTHLVECIKPKEMIILAMFNARGGITTDVMAHYIRDIEGGPKIITDIHSDMDI